MRWSYSFKPLLKILLVFFTLFAPAVVHGQSLYEQAPSTSGGLFSNAGGLIAADQFVLKETTAITAVRWYGFIQDPSIVLSDMERTRLRFRIRFFEDASGTPARQISQQDVSARVVSTEVRTRFSSPDRSPLIYEFTAASLEPVTINGGATMWISISAVEAPSLWLWSRSIAGVTDTLAVKDETPVHSDPLDWHSNGKFGQLAFGLFTGRIGDFPLSRPEPPPRPSLRSESDRKPLTSGSTVRPVSIAARSEPQYTDFARRARVIGTVVMSIVVRKDGSVDIMGIVEGLGFGLDEAAQSTLQRWRFNPGVRDGQPVDSPFYMEVTLNLR
jgi:TonB family protein